jgi:hypothetical protein
MLPDESHLAMVDEAPEAGIGPRRRLRFLEAMALGQGLGVRINHRG